MNLQEKTAIITGGARGIGQATALKLANKGINIVIADISNEVNKTVKKIKELGKKAIYIKTDVSNKEEVQLLIEKTLKRFNSIDILINNAGISQFNISFEDIKEEEWNLMMNINLKGVFFCCQAVLPYMKSKRSGKIVNLASIAAKTGGIKSGAHYAAAKAGVITLTKSVAKSGAPYGINVNAVSPGIIETDMTKNVAYEISSIPLGRLGKAEEVAEVICFLASDAARYITGEIVDVDGGMSMD